MGSERFNHSRGWYFTPTDDDLIEEFLKPKVFGQTPIFDFIKEKQVYGGLSCNPWQIFDPNEEAESWFVPPFKKSEKVMYVFTNLSKIAKSSSEETRSRVNMCKTAGRGTWVGETGKEKIMDCDGNVIGETRLLVFKNNEIDSAAGEAQFRYYKMHEYCLSGIYGTSTLVLCKITYDSTKKSSFVKRAPKNSGKSPKKPVKLGTKRVSKISAKSRKKQESSNKKDLVGSVSDNLVVEGRVCENLNGVVCDDVFVLSNSSEPLLKKQKNSNENVEGGVGDSVVECSVGDNLVECSAGDNLVVDRSVCENLVSRNSGEPPLKKQKNCNMNLQGGVGVNLVECIVGDNLVECSAGDNLVVALDVNEFGEDLVFSFDDDWIQEYCAEGSFCDDLLAAQEVNSCGKDLCINDPTLVSSTGDEWMQELVKHMQQELVEDTNLRKRKFDAENGCGLTFLNE
ncbi:hypothetical protein POM88_025517 [Heracleum sosnowskyi]|uniref:NAC domain-containing protein n=1 Tax=Heracleum sosnowskyi TaxID=360622 RepID=A0AAD8I4Q7_9APIA|nr:hypothetical protein POM88_025517 [Heracleum sosnowskyi]